MKLFGILIGCVALAVLVNAADLTDQNKKFLAAYEKAHLALVTDDLSGRRKRPRISARKVRIWRTANRSPRHGRLSRS